MSTEGLTYRQVFAQWLPLALSWAMMSVAGPIVNAGIARLPDAATNLAAYGLTQEIAVLVESPIIMTLSAAVSLIAGRESYALLQRFVTHMTIALTLLGILVYYTPLYNVLFLGILAVPADIAAASLWPMRLMILWPMAIAWRRLYQGILIRHGRTKLVSYGTVFRLLSLIVTVVVGVRLGTMSGALVGALALAISVMVEMIVIVWWSLPLLRARVLTVEDRPGTVMSYRQFIRFYLPLAGTDIMRVASGPITTAGIARALDPALSLAAWPAARNLSMLLSSPVMALQEVVLSQIKDREAQRRLTVFCMTVGAIFTAILALLVFTPLSDWWFSSVIGVPESVKQLAVPAARVVVLMPLLFAARNLLRAVLISRRQSGRVQTAMTANLVALVVFLVLGVGLTNLQGIFVAMWASVGAQVVETVMLRWLGRDEPRAREAVVGVD